MFERFGEHLGYGLAALVLGPRAALERRARRAMRAAMLDYCRDLHPLKLDAPRGSIRRSAQVPTPVGSLSVELEVDLDARKAWASAPLERLPSYVSARVTKSPSSLGDTAERGAKAFPGDGEARAIARAFRLETASLDDGAAAALVEAVASGPLDDLDALELILSPEHVKLLFMAPATRESWATVGAGVTSLVSWLGVRWPPSYR